MAARLAIGALLVAALPSAASADVHLSLRNGRVTLQATNATVRQILTEWARVGQTKIVNVERIGGGPLTLELTNMPEREALDLLLRSVAGYMAAERTVFAADLSQFDRILVLATAAVPRVATAPAPAPSFGGRPPFVQLPQDADNDDQPSVPPARGPLFPTFPNAAANPAAGASLPGIPSAQGVVPLPAQAETPAFSLGGQPTGGVTATPAAVGSPRPGMVVQPAPAPAPAQAPPGQ